MNEKTEMSPERAVRLGKVFPQVGRDSLVPPLPPFVSARQAGGPYPLKLAPGGAAGFVIYVALLTILTAGAVGGFMLYAAFQHSQAARRWHAADQSLLDAQSALEQVKYGISQAYVSNGQASVKWFLTWSSNTIGTASNYTIPSPLTVNGTPVFVTLARVALVTNAGNSLVTLTLVADARKSDMGPISRKLQEQMQIQIRMDTGGVPISANCALGMYGTNNAVNVGGQLTVDGDNWNPPATFNRGSGSTNPASTNDLPGVVYNATKITTGARISISGNPPQTNATGGYDAIYWTQFLNTVLPLATTYAGGSLGTRDAPVITKLPSGGTTFSTPTSGAGILIVPIEANISINQNFYYEGLVVLVADNTKAKDLLQNLTTTIYGSLVCLGNRCGLNIKGTFNVLYSKQALANLANITNLPQSLKQGTSVGTNAPPITIGWKEIH